MAATQNTPRLSATMLRGLQTCLVTDDEWGHRNIGGMYYGRMSLQVSGNTRIALTKLGLYGDTNAHGWECITEAGRARLA